ncbi:PREDICTED: hsp70-binding protein 1-like [Dinoponera quadriceps]|uniref:Hsp70-binding protein 1-like n=1 Tax=Dinoponera quadriceps TaxID=609295 RepID=A0A6P3YAS4_DINQU|nr:PREDICTED: hsp70-binding protein 1-like [Dinoponera quadriceps]
MDKPEDGNSKKNAEQNESNSRQLSIEGPSTSNSAERTSRLLQPLLNQPKQPTNLQGLLKYAIDVAQLENIEDKSQIYPLDEEKKTFLSNALSSLTANVIEELQEDIQTLSGIVNLKADADSSMYENALKRIGYHVDNIDVANDFHKIGGFSLFQLCLNSSHSNIRWRIADIIAKLAQNNPYCQEKILETGLFPILLSMVDTDPSEHSKIKALYAVSCIVRENPTSLKYMEINDGYSVLLRALQSSTEKLQIKSAFLLSNLCSKENSSDIKHTLVKMGFIEQAIGLLSRDNLQLEIREQLLRMLCSMVSDNFLPALEELRRPQLRSKFIFDMLLSDFENNQNERFEDNRDEKEMCIRLLEKISSEFDTNQER